MFIIEIAEYIFQYVIVTIRIGKNILVQFFINMCLSYCIIEMYCCSWGGFFILIISTVLGGISSGLI